MKFTLLLPALALALAGKQAEAQTETSTVGLKRIPTEKGSFLIGANLVNAAAGFGGDTYHYYSISASPRAGYFITDNWVAGLTLNGMFYATGDYRARAFGAGIFSRYYFGKSVDRHGELNRLRLFAEAGVGYVRGASRTLGPAGDRTWHRANGGTAYGVLGLSYFLTSNVALELGLSYQRDLRSNTGYDQPNQLGLNIGFQLFLPKRKARRPVGMLQE